MTARLQALKSELEKRSLVLDEEGLKVCGQLMEVFPSYAMESVSAVVAMLSKDFAGNSEGLMSACVDFLLDEDSPSLKAFLSETSQNKDPGSMTPDDKFCRDKVWRSVELLQSMDTSDTCNSSISSRSGSPSLLHPEEEDSQNAASLVPFPSFSEATSRSKEDYNLCDSLNKTKVIFSAASSHAVAHHCEEDSNADSSVDLLLSSIANDCSTALPETRPYPLAGDYTSSSSSAAACHSLKDVESDVESAGRKSVSSPSPSLDSDSSDTLPDYEFNEDFPSSFRRVVNSSAIIIQPKIVNLTSNSATAETSANKQQDSISSLSSFAPHSDMGLHVSDVGLCVSDAERSTKSILNSTHLIGGSSRQLPVAPSVANASFCDEKDTDMLNVHPTSSLKSLKPASFRIPSAFVRETSISSTKVTDNVDEQVLPSIVSPRQRCSSQKLKSLEENPTAGLSQAPCAIHPSLFQSNAHDTAGISHSETEGIVYLGKSSPQVPNQSVSQRSLLDHPPSISLVAPSEQQQSKTVLNMHPNSGSEVCIGNLSVAPAGLLQSKTVQTPSPSNSCLVSLLDVSNMHANASSKVSIDNLSVAPAELLQSKTVQTPSPSNSRLVSLLGVSNMHANASSKVSIDNLSVAPAELLQSKTVQTPSPSNSRLVSLLGVSNMHPNASSKVSVGNLSVAPAELLQSKTVQTPSPSNSRLVNLLGVSNMHPSADLQVNVSNLPVPRPTATETSGPKDNRSDAVRKLDDLAAKYHGNGNHMGALKTTAQCISTCSLQEPKTFKTDTSVASTHPVLSLLSYPPVPANTVLKKLDLPSSSSYSVNSSLPRVSLSLNPSSTFSTVYTQQQPLRLVYPHSHLTCDLGVRPPITSCHPSDHNKRNGDLAASHWTNSTHTNRYHLLAGSSGVTSVQLTAVTHGVTAGRQDPVPSTSGYRKRLNAEALHTMASVNSQKEDGKSDASKRKESSGVDRWDYRDYPDIVIDDSLNDSQGSVQFMENSPQRAMNNPAGPLKTEQLPEHRGLDFAVQSVIEVFPNIEITYVRDMLKRFLAAGVVWNHALNNVLNQLLENPNFPTCLDSSHSVQLTKKPKKDYFNDYSAPVIVASSAIATAAWDLLSWDFRMIARNEIKQVMSRYNYHYAPVYRCLTKAMASTREVKSSSPDSKSRVITVVCHEGKGNEWKAVFYLLKKPRMLGKHVKEFIQHLPPELKAETEFVQDYLKQEKEESDRQIAWQLLEKEYYEEGQAIECGCCYTQYPFEKLVQCFDGHLFCCDCLQGYAREAIFGSGKLNLMCMTEGCETTFPKSQLIKALPDDVMQKYDERLAEESLNMAEISDLVRCPYCNLAAVLDANVQIFECPGPSCQKTTCRDCKEDWEDHMGKSCEEVEKKDETKLRKEYEEKMTSLKVRTCPRCKAQFFKEEGCNKMICRCGATMCYLCRKPSITYKHFCQHPRDPGKGCTQCTACSLWTNPDEDEKKAIAEVQREAQVQRKEHGYLDNKVIGVPDAPPAKKRKK